MTLKQMIEVLIMQHPGVLESEMKVYLKNANNTFAESTRLLSQRVSKAQADLPNLVTNLAQYQAGSFTVGYDNLYYTPFLYEPLVSFSTDYGKPVKVTRAWLNGVEISQAGMRSHYIWDRINDRLYMGIYSGSNRAAGQALTQTDNVYSIEAVFDNSDFSDLADSPAYDEQFHEAPLLKVQQTLYRRAGQVREYEMAKDAYRELVVLATKHSNRERSKNDIVIPGY